MVETVTATKSHHNL